ncbi:hypothetical protein OIV83_001375 [Microbotryomycetes sp. JL201]|nr:hypothetical protein OIV83_001375 [Microbotryomycetes sp. JL201]
MPRVDLFGGAIQAEYPPNLTDASRVSFAPAFFLGEFSRGKHPADWPTNLRQVPDTQEVYLANDSDLSIILEVLELVTDNGAGDNLESGIRFHFDSLAHDNSALSSSVTSVSSTTSDDQATAQTPILGPATLLGIQTVSKFNLPADQADKVQLCVALWRLPTKNVDLVLCVNMPFGKANQNATSNGVDHDGGDREARHAQDVFEQIVRTLDIKDFGLFAGGA